MIIDVNVNLSRWPFRRLAGDEPAALVAKLKSQDVQQAWASSFDGLLHKDLRSVNDRLVDDCLRHGDGLLLPFGCVNPSLPDWQDDLRRCHDVHQMRGIRLFPAYHGYSLADPRLAELLADATRRQLIVTICWRLEDERTQHPILKLQELDGAPLAEAIPKTPGLRLVVLNGLRDLTGAKLDRLVRAGEVHFDIAMQEGVGGVGRLIGQVGVERVVFGSHYPFFLFESARLKLVESALKDDRLELVQQGNARRLLGSS